MEPAPGFRFEWGPDLERVSNLIVDTWSRPCWNYDLGLLQLHILRPTGDPALTLSQAAANGDLVSFQAFMPFDVEYFGRSYRAVFASFLTVSSEYHGKGLGGPQQAALIERAIERGYDLYITMCEVGAASNASVEKTFGRMGLEAKVVRVLNYLASRGDFLKPILPATSSPNTRLATAKDIPAIMDLTPNFGAGVDLRKIIAPSDVEFLFISRPHTRTYVYEIGGRIKAVINVLILEVLDTVNSDNLYFDNVYFGDISEAEQLEFVGDCLNQLQETNFQLAFMPDIGYANSEPFRKFRFRAAPRQLNLYVVALKPGALPDGVRAVNSFYLDVY